MAIATTLREFLESHNLAYDAVRHEHAETSQRAASAAGQPGDKVAKSVLLKDEEGYLVAVLPVAIHEPCQSVIASRRRAIQPDEPGSPRWPVGRLAMTSREFSA